MGVDAAVGAAVGAAVAAAVAEGVGVKIGPTGRGVAVARAVGVDPVDGGGVGVRVGDGLATGVEDAVAVAVAAAVGLTVGVGVAVVPGCWAKTSERRPAPAMVTTIVNARARVSHFLVIIGYLSH